MTTAERVNKQIKELAANSKFLTSIINENKDREYIQSKIDLLKPPTTEQESAVKRKNVVYYSEKELCFDTMLHITNFILYNDNPNETDHMSKNKYLQTHRCDYKMTKSDLKEIDTFAKELDTIESDLAEINANLKTYKHAYSMYCENLMRFIDQKDILMAMFLNYYDEYFLLRRYKKPVKATRLTSEKSSMYQSEQNLTFPKKATRKQSFQCSSVNKPAKKDGYMSDDSCFMSHSNIIGTGRKIRSAKSTQVYVSSVPTENRFALLAAAAKNKQKSAVRSKKFLEK